MKYMSRNIRKAAAALALAGVMALGACNVAESFGPGETPVPGAQESEVTLTVNVPGLQNPTTKGETLAQLQARLDRQFDGILRVELLLFSVDDSNPSDVVETFIKRVTASSITDISAGTDIKYSFKAMLPATNNCRIVLLINTSSGMMKDYDAVLAGLTPGDTKKSILEKLVVDLNNDNGKERFASYPMYGETGKINIAPGSRIDNISLTRTFARAEVYNQATNFTFACRHTQGVHDPTTFCNEVVLAPLSYFEHYLAPHWRSNDGQIINPSPKTPNITGVKYNPYRWDVDFPCYPEVGVAYGYLLESPAITNSDNQDGTYLIIHGKYSGDNKEYFYRVDFTYDGTNGTKGQYMPILRNHKYVVYITSCSGPGYDTREEAANSHTVISNLRTRIIYYDEAKIKDIEFNGQYMLGVGESPKTVSADIQNFSMDIFTDNPNYQGVAWKGEIVDPTGAGAWLRFQSGQTTYSGASGLGTIPLKTIEKNTTGASRTAYIDLTAGRLRKTVAVTQGIGSNVTLRIIDEDGNEVLPSDQVFFPFYKGAKEAPDAKKFFLVWEPADATVFKARFGGGYDVSLTTASDNPLTKIYTGGFAELKLQPTAVTVDEAHGEPFYLRSCVYEFQVSDAYGNVSEVQKINIKQGDMYMEVEEEYTFVMDGSTSDFKFTTNTDWEATFSGDLSFISSSTAKRTGTAGVDQTFSFTMIDGLNTYDRVAYVTFRSPDNLYPPKVVKIKGEIPMFRLISRTAVGFTGTKVNGAIDAYIILRAETNTSWTITTSGGTLVGTSASMGASPKAEKTLRIDIPKISSDGWSNTTRSGTITIAYGGASGTAVTQETNLYTQVGYHITSVVGIPDSYGRQGGTAALTVTGYFPDMYIRATKTPLGTNSNAVFIWGAGSPAADGSETSPTITVSAITPATSIQDVNFAAAEPPYTNYNHALGSTKQYPNLMLATGRLLALNDATSPSAMMDWATAMGLPAGYNAGTLATNGVGTITYTPTVLTGCGAYYEGTTTDPKTGQGKWMLMDDGDKVEVGNFDTGNAYYNKAVAEGLYTGTNALYWTSYDNFGGNIIVFGWDNLSRWTSGNHSATWQAGALSGKTGLARARCVRNP